MIERILYLYIGGEKSRFGTKFLPDDERDQLFSYIFSPLKKLGLIPADFQSYEPVGKLRKTGGHWSNRQVRPDAYEAQNIEELLYDVESAYLMTRKLAIGKADGHHGVFLKQKIEALTVKGLYEKSNLKGIHNLENKQTLEHLADTGYLIESVSRSVNNLLELFHQSFFYYILPRNDRYVSNGDYFIPLVLTILVPFVFGVRFWFTKSDKPDALIEYSLFSKFCLLSFLIAGLAYKNNSYFAVLGLIVPIIYKQLDPEYANFSNSTEHNTNAFKSLFCICLGNLMLCCSLINFSLVFLTNLLLIPFLVIILLGKFKLVSEMVSAALIAVPIYFLQAEIEAAREYNLALDGDYLTFNYLMLGILPFLILLRFVI